MFTSDELNEYKDYQTIFSDPCIYNLQFIVAVDVLTKHHHTAMMLNETFTLLTE